MTFSRLHITAFVAFAALVWGLMLAVQGTVVGPEHLAPFSSVVGSLVLLGLAFEHVLWRQRFLHGWFVKRPDLRGTWRVELQSSYVQPETDERVSVIVCYMGVQQTLSKLQMHLMTPESESEFIAERVRESPSGNGYQVIGVYANEPDILLRDERISEMHKGAIIIVTHGPGWRPESLTGKYWTDRKTIGTMEFTGRVDKVFTRFMDADRAFAKEVAL